MSCGVYSPIFERRGVKSRASSSGGLTIREQEILTLFAQGNSYGEIAKARGNSPLTIRNAVYRIQDKLGYSTKQEIVVWAVSQWSIG